MFDKAFLSKVTILYVEDDIGTQEATAEIFENFFKTVLVANDGLEALQIYKDSIKSQKKIDVIISDINMPNKNGIELLKEVRAISSDIPFIFTTAYSDSPNLLNAIKYKVTSYVLKPVNTLKLILEVQEYSLQISKEYKSTKDEFNEYLKTIDSVALFLRTNSNGCITYANKLFLEISRYKSEDIIGKDCSIFKYPNISDDDLEKMNIEIKTGKIWKNKIGLKAKDDSIFYIDTTVLPMYDGKNEEIVEYLYISFFLSTQEIKKTDIKKKTVETLENNLTVKEIISELKAQVSKYKHMNMVKESLEKEKLEKQNNIKRIKDFEKNATTYVQ